MNQTPKTDISKKITTQHPGSFSPNGFIFDDIDGFTDSDIDSDSDSDDSLNSDMLPPVIVSDFMKMSGKLDSILHLLMNEIKIIFSDPTASPEDVIDFYTQALLKIFERSVLPTYKSRYAQFLWFYACSLDSGLTEAFLVLLAQKTFDATCPSIIRISASAYLASFVARAKFLDVTSVLYCIRILNGWALQYVETHEMDVRQPDAQKYSVFYSVVQALLYIFCFQWKHVMSTSGSASSYGQLPPEMNGLQRIVNSKFSPLKV